MFQYIYIYDFFLPNSKIQSRKSLVQLTVSKISVTTSIFGNQFLPSDTGYIHIYSAENRTELWRINLESFFAKVTNIFGMSYWQGIDKMQVLCK